MAETGIVQMVGPAVVLLTSAVVAVPLFRKLGLGSVLGYFSGGLLVGPSVLGIFTEPSTILHISELGVVMFLFLIGLEMRPQKLWALRGQIFGLGLAQVAVCIALLTGAGVLYGLAPATAFIAGSGFVLSSTAVIMSVLQERGELAGGQGQRAVSILLLEDLMIVPLLVVVTFMSPASGAANGVDVAAVATALGAIGLVIAAGRWLLDPFFALLARARATEVLTAGALLVVLGSALLMEYSGLSMAMGAFLAGVMLSGSGYRHQIETDIEPFKGLLMGLFFLAVGMSLDLAVVAAQWHVIVALLALFVAVKSIGIYAVARAFGATNRQGLRRVSLFAQGGEFAFVLYTAAVSGGVIDASDNAVFASVVILSMALTPLTLLAADRWLDGDARASLDGVEAARGLRGRVLIIGFGRFGQIASQALLAQGIDVSLIDNDPDRIREAEKFGFKVYYGDGRRLDILRHSGAETADAIMVCIDDRAGVNRIVELVRQHFPSGKLLVRSYDRGHAIGLRNSGVDYEMRETLESALAFGGAGLQALGMTAFDAGEVIDEIRRRDQERLAAQIQEGVLAGRDLLHVAPRPEPLITPRGRAAGRET
ncbi:monovalent cation:proton antiporter-2 (CPA2) family protein [Aquisalimonas lutea]|uniref:monovalent cation:proton antiporter-2 (CPA2) family protein n=1 Tax=Aquisalimonas lutea TaxID=1327750 RepID=UPI0025B45BB1|nr:monovalent cation:proton antiporter-2 (CPA2) family protein [Aquisalimonas lutea]MDN3516538.1 monovalent cation:proton antiporter-2 (CPA2) family protein [Aquisalimonas lutea]